MMVNKFLEMYDEETLAKTLIERANMLVSEVVFEFMAASTNYKTADFANEMRLNTMKGEILAETLDTLEEAIDRLTKKTLAARVAASEAAKQAEAPKDHKDMTRTERIDEIMNQICTFAGMIENFPDWLERMKHLNFVAMCLAMGCNDYNFTCKEPGQE